MGRVIAVSLCAFVLAACSSSPKGSGDGGGGSGGGGGAPVDMTASGPPDLIPRSIAGIACGAIACTTTLELCCTSDSGKTGDCQKVQNPMCGASEFLCDGPEDCEPANPECCVQGGYAACRPAGFCATQANARVMCHVDADCTPFVASALCRSPRNGSPYQLCI